jgi:uncharacterized protein YdiU (UPF0061 family)
MADLTLGTVEKLLGLLTTVIKDEVELQRGVQGDIQFIKDEMDSMNGFLLHLTKTETVDNDQHRAWMKQVRDIAYIAQDCIELYMCDRSPPEGGGCLASARRHNPKVLLWTWRKRRLKDDHSAGQCMERLTLLRGSLHINIAKGSTIYRRCTINWILIYNEKYP